MRVRETVVHLFESRLAVTWPKEQWQNVVVVAAISGGADSVALLRGLVAVTQDSKSNLVVAHFNHGLREAADDDERFVLHLTRELGVRYETGHPATSLAQSPGGSLESAARDARYGFLTATARAVGARYVVTAHTQDDQVETILHRVIRGTGLRGLGGIPRSRELAPGLTLFRPLLSVRRSEILQYLAEIEQPCRQDESNADSQFTRNRIRNELLPLLAKRFNTNVAESLIKLGKLADEAATYLESLADQLLVEVQLRSDQCELEICCNRLDEANPFLVREMLKAAWNRMSWPLQDMNYDRWSELARLASDSVNDKTTLCLPGGVEATRTGQSLRLTRSGN